MIQKLVKIELVVKCYVKFGKEFKVSRIGKQVIELGKDVSLSLANDQVTVSGKGKTLQVPFDSSLELKIQDEVASITRKNDQAKTRSLHGLYRSLINNAVMGITKGWSKTLVLNGVGYKASVSGKTLVLNLGYSQPISFPVPEGIELKVEKQTRIEIKGIDKELVGRVAQKIRSFRPPEPYLGKGVKYEDEVIRRKAGKSGGDKK